jgi:hypothetical protein
MSNKYSHEQGIKKFYYIQGSHYCVIVAKDIKTVRRIGHKVLDHYLGHAEYHQKEFIDTRKGKPAGALIHVKGNIAEKLTGETKFEDIDIELCPVDFEERQQRKNGLKQLIDMNS